MADDALALPPSLAGRYQATRLLGTGAFGRVLRATRRSDGQEVALKLLVGELASQPVVRERFFREGRAGARLQHPNVVGVLELGEQDPPYLVQELVEGGTLDELLRAHPQGLDPSRVVPLMEGILAGLEAAHAQGITHRDLKPANVLLDGSGCPRLADFGLAHGAHEATLTATGTILGTPLYMAPGQVLGEAPTPAWDVYAAAAIHYELLVGRPAFEGDTLGAILDAKQRGLVAGPAAQGAAVPATLDKLLRAALGPDHASQFPDVASYRRAWDRQRQDAAAPVLATGEHGPPSIAATALLSEATPRPPSPPQPTPAPRSPPAPLGPRLAMGLGLLAAVAWGWSQGGGTTPPPAPTPTGLGEIAARNLEERLEALRRRLHQAPEVQAALALEGPDQSTGAWDALRAARAVVERGLEEAELLPVVSWADQGELPVRALQALLEVVALEKLLGRAKRGAEFVDIRGDRQRELDEAFRRLVAFRRIPPPGLTRSPFGGVPAILEEATADGTRWRMIRGYFTMPKARNEAGELVPNSRVWRQSPLGHRFEDPVSGKARTLLDIAPMKIHRDLGLISAATDDITIPLEVSGGQPLEMILTADGLDATIQGLVELRGGDTLVRFPLWFGLEEYEAVPEPPAGHPTWFRLRVHPALVPAGTRELFLRFRGIQPLTDGEALAYPIDFWTRQP